MACDRFEALILDALDGALAPADRAALDEHLAGCGACRAFQDEQARLDAALAAAITAPSLSPTFKQQVLSRVDVMSARPARGALLLGILQAIASAASAAAAALLLRYVILALPSFAETPEALNLTVVAGACTGTVVVGAASAGGSGVPASARPMASSTAARGRSRNSRWLSPATGSMMPTATRRPTLPSGRCSAVSRRAEALSSVPRPRETTIVISTRPAGVALRPRSAAPRRRGTVRPAADAAGGRYGRPTGRVATATPRRPRSAPLHPDMAGWPRNRACGAR